jgi:hypothetical protein
VVIQKVTLRGAGIESTIRPIEYGAVDPFHPFFLSINFCSENYFHFFGLPAGTYEVEIVAQGFKPHVKTYVVKPGQPIPARAIELVPLH